MATVKIDANQIRNVGVPTDGTYLDGFCQDLTSEDHPADAVDKLNETIRELHPFLPVLGELAVSAGTVGDGRMFAPDWPGVALADSPFQLAGIAEPQAVLPPWALQSGTLPTTVARHSFTYDSIRNVFVYHGGASPDDNTGNPVNTMYEYDPATWIGTDVTPGAAPVCQGHLAVFNPADGWTYFMGGGMLISDPGFLRRWNGTTFEEAALNAPVDLGPYDPSMCLAGDGKIYAWGGCEVAYYTVLNVFDPTTRLWSQITQAVVPSPRTTGRMVYVPTLDLIVLIGGEYYDPDTSAYVDRTDIWAYNVTAAGDWVERTFIANGWVGGYSHCLWWAPVQGRLVMIGGYTDNLGAPIGTWECDPTVDPIVWAPYASTPDPSGRGIAASTYYTVGNQLVMAGGMDSVAGDGSYLADIWFLLDEVPAGYDIGPFNPGDIELVTNQKTMTFRTRGPVRGLTAGTRLRAHLTADNIAWTDYGTDLVLNGSTTPQSNATWRVYGNPDGTGDLHRWPVHNGDISGYIECCLRLWTFGSIVVTPTTSTVNPAQGTTTLTAVGLDTEGDECYSAAVLAANGVWASGDLAVLTSDGNGQFTIVAEGETDITVTYLGVTGTAHVVVSPLSYILITPPARSEGGYQSFTFTAAGFDSGDLEVVDAATLAADGVWAAVALNVAVSDGGGQFSITGMGSTQISVTYQGVVGTATYGMSLA